MNKDINESANINPGPSKETFFLHNYEELWTYNSLQENYWNTKNADEIVTVEELKAALKEWKIAW